MRAVAIALVAGLAACALAGVILSSVTDPAYAIIGSVLVGVAAMLWAALLIDRFYYRR